MLQSGKLHKKKLAKVHEVNICITHARHCLHGYEDSKKNWKRHSSMLYREVTGDIDTCHGFVASPSQTKVFTRSR